LLGKLAQQKFLLVNFEPDIGSFAHWNFMESYISPKTFFLSSVPLFRPLTHYLPHPAFPGRRHYHRLSTYCLRMPSTFVVFRCEMDLIDGLVGALSNDEMETLRSRGASLISSSFTASASRRWGQKPRLAPAKRGISLSAF